MTLYNLNITMKFLQHLHCSDDLKIEMNLADLIHEHSPGRMNKIFSYQIIKEIFLENSCQGKTTYFRFYVC